MPKYCAVCKTQLPEGSANNVCSFKCGKELHEKLSKGQTAPKKKEPEKPRKGLNVQAKKKFYEGKAHPPQAVQPCKSAVAMPSKKKRLPKKKEEPPRKEEKPPEQLKVWLLTWNCANTKPSKDQLDQLIVSRVPGDKPDMIVIGVQEYPRQDRIPKKIEQSLKDYRFISENVVKGLSGGTWYKFGLNGLNCQAVGALVKTGVRAETSVKANGNRKYGKGGVILGIKITKNKSEFGLAFISAHLDSYDKKEDDIKRIINAFPKRQFDAVFMMGDLNYRLDPKGKTFTRTGICNMISNNPGELLNGHDELLSSSLVKEGPYQFEFPDPSARFPPTYKIKSYTVGNHLLTYFGAKGAEEPNKKLKPKKKRTGIDIGWLDRIGWAKKWAGILSGKGEVAQEEFIGLHEVDMSDHAAVLMKVTVSVKK